MSASLVGSEMCIRDSASVCVCEVMADEADGLAMLKVAHVLGEKARGKWHLKVGNGDLVSARHRDVTIPGATPYQR
eukprot:1279167-Alexandrium_andersonii.AAC.1